MYSGYWDIHNHILPGVDDGASCMEECLLLLEAEYAQGIRNMILTPHYRPGVFDVTAAEHQQVYQEVCESIKDNFPDLQIYLGCEYYTSDHRFERLSEVQYRMAGTKIILLEFSTSSDFEKIQMFVSDVRDKDCWPIIAHAERYQCLYKDKKRVCQLKKMGAAIQLNADSVIGRNGLRKKRFCYRLLADDLVDFIASDAHDMDKRPVCMGACMDKIMKKFGKKRVDCLFRENAVRFFVDRIEPTVHKESEKYAGN
jgi:protein-tyrosine phosphatase